jgi:hypothetical protein
MKAKNRVLFVILIIVYIPLRAQNPKPIYRKISDETKRMKREADSLAREKQYTKAAGIYKDIIRREEEKVPAMYWLNIASYYSLAGETDSGMVYLQKATDRGYGNYAIMQADPELKPLHQDARWKIISEQVSSNRLKRIKHPNIEVIRALDTVTINDQSIRGALADAREKYGMKSKQYQELKTLAEKYDSANLVIVERILDQYGWLGKEEIGEEGGIAIYLVILHAPLEYQQKHYEQVKAAIDKKYMHPFILCYLDDKIAMAKGEQQIYGTQVGMYEGTERYFVQPVMDVEHLDERRAGRGLESMTDYLKSFGIGWSVEYYKKELHKVEKELKRQEKNK